jgi:hypothetical protein
VSRQSTPPHTNQPYTNGHYETPLEISGVSLRRPLMAQKPTIFVPDLPLKGIGPLLYALQRFQIGGLAFARYLAIFWIGIGALAAIGVIPGLWFTAILAFLLLITQIALTMRYRHRQYVSFTPTPSPTPNDDRLEASEKVPVYVTGLLGVEGRYQRYCALPGFYRTFAIGEHALLCRVQERKWLGISSWPLEEIGMWYAFIKPSEIRDLAWGTFHFGATTLPGIAITYQLEIPPGPRRKRAELREEVLYIATPDQHEAQRVYVDLLNNLPTEQLAKYRSAQHHS